MLANGFFFKSLTAIADMESRIKFLTLNAGEIVTPYWSIFLKSLATSRNLFDVPKYPIDEIESKSMGSRTLK